MPLGTPEGRLPSRDSFRRLPVLAGAAAGGLGVSRPLGRRPQVAATAA